MSDRSSVVFCSKSILLGWIIGALMTAPLAGAAAFYFNNKITLAEKLGCAPGVPVRAEGRRGVVIATCDNKEPSSDKASN